MKKKALNMLVKVQNNAIMSVIFQDGMIIVIVIKKKWSNFVKAYISN